MSTVFIGPGDGSTSVAAEINAALADPSVTHVVLAAGLFMLDEPIVIPSGKSLEGAGRDETLLKVSDAFTRSGAGEEDGVVNTVRGATDVSLSDFAIDAGSVRPEGFRLHGCFMREAIDFSVTRVDVHNATGYAHFAQGDANTMLRYASGTYQDCLTTNSQIHFEQMYVDGVTLIDCHGRDGAGTLNGIYFHPVLGSRNVSYIDCTGYGRPSSAGLDMLADWLLPLENITIMNTHIEVFGGGPGLIAQGANPHLNVQIVGSSFIAHHSPGALLFGVQANLVDTVIQGSAVGLYTYPAGNGVPSIIQAVNSHAIALRDPAGTSAAYAIVATGPVEWLGGTIEARGAAGLMFAFGAGAVAYDEATQIIRTGFDANTAYSEDGEAALLAPDLLFGIPEGDYSGGTLTVRHDSWSEAADRIFVAGADPAVTVADGHVLLHGEPIGTVSGGAGGEALTIALLPGADAHAVQALVRSLAFENASDTPLASTRLFAITLRDAAGAVAGQASAATRVVPVDDATALSLAGAQLVWKGGQPPAAIAPAATLADPDAPSLAGATLTVSLGASFRPGDVLGILDGGEESGGIALSGATVLHAGVEIATFAGGTGGATLVIGFLSGATLAAAEALVRAVSYGGPPVGEDGARSVAFTLHHPTGGAAAHEANIVFLKGEPAVPEADAAGTGEAEALTLDVLANDHDPDGGPTLVVAVNGQAVVPGGSVTLPSGAIVTLNTDGTLRYDPAGAFGWLAASGSGASNTEAVDRFTYTEAGGGEADVEITVTGLASPDDAFHGTAGDDVFDGTAEGQAFRLDGGGDDRVSAGGGDDNIHFGAALTEADTVDGGDGDDTLILHGPYDFTWGGGHLTGIERLVLLTGGQDGPFGQRFTLTDDALAAGAVLAVDLTDLAANERATFDGSAETDAAFVLAGGAGADTLYGGALADRLDGGGGADDLRGGGGDDLYFVDDLADLVVEAEGGGMDEVRTALGSRDDYAGMYVLPGFVENFTGLSAAGQGVFANGLDNVVRMGAGADLVVLQDGGIDRVYGGGGDDFLFFGGAMTADDLADGGSGYDTVGLLGRYDLSFGARSLLGVEKLAVYSSGGGEGVALNHYSLVTADANVGPGQSLMVVGLSLLASESLSFNGSAELDGSFNLRGGRGQDVLTGGAKADQIYGNLGADLLAGGAGKDMFEYYSAAESTAAARDTILDFAAGDRINLQDIDANGDAAGNAAFAFIGARAFGGKAGELRVTAAAENGWLVEGDIDGDGAADLVILVKTVGNHVLGAADFWL